MQTKLPTRFTPVWLTLLLIAPALFFSSAASAAPEGLVNMSVRSTAGVDAKTLIVGFVVDGDANVLLRGVGPTLTEFHVPGALPDPVLRLFNGSADAGINDDWAQGSATAAQFSALGAFGMAADSKDAALSLPISGARTAHLTGKDGAVGIGLVELYHTGEGSGKLVNISARTEVGTGANVLVTGFVIGGDKYQRLLIRAIGPTLTQYQVPGALADPVLTLFKDGQEQLSNDDWGSNAAELQAAFASTSAFELVDGSKDAALVVNLAPGLYTAQVSGKNNTTGVALVEVYAMGEGRFFRLKPLALRAFAPSIVSAAILVTDFAGQPVNGLTIDDFEALENGQPLTSESFLRLEPITNIPYTFNTVLMIDVSSSITAADLVKIKEAASNFIRDPLTGESNLLPNQRVGVYVFDDTVRQIASFTNDADSLVTSIAGITRGGPSTNLYGAIVAGMGAWTDSYLPDSVTAGALVLVTDGNDTANLVTKQAAINAVAGRNFFAVPVGNGADANVLREIAGSGGTVLPADGYEQLGAKLEEIVAGLPLETDGRYLLYYATPRRSGTHTLTIRAVDNINQGTDSQVSGQFNATGFTNVTPQVTVRTAAGAFPPSRIYLGEKLELRASTRWSNDPANYQWTVFGGADFVALTPSAANGGETALLTGVEVSAGFSFSTIDVVDLNWPTAPLFRHTIQVASSAPNNIRSETAVASGQITIRWDVVPPADHYFVYWKEAASTVEPTKVQVMTGTSHTFTGLVDGKEYSFRVSTVVQGTEGAQTAELLAQPEQPNPPIAWQRSFGGSESDVLVAAIQTSDGGFLLGGHSNSPVSGTKTAPLIGNYDFWVIKLDPSGAKQWEHTFGGIAGDELHSVAQLTAGGYIIGGFSYVDGSKRLRIVKLNASGGTTSQQVIDPILFQLDGVKVFPDGGYMIFARDYPVNKPWGLEGVAVRYNVNGTRVWTSEHGPVQLHSMSDVPGGGYLFGGNYSYSGNNQRYVGRASASGVKLSGANYAQTQTSAGRTFAVPTATGGYLTAFQFEQYPFNAQTGDDVFLQRVESNSSLSWQFLLGGNGAEEPVALLSTADGGFLIGATSSSNRSFDRSTPRFGTTGDFGDYWLVKINDKGAKQWERAAGGSGTDQLAEVLPLTDGGFLLAGSSASGVSGNKETQSYGADDFWIVRVAAP